MRLVRNGILRWMAYWHGVPAEPHQWNYYRCRGCQRVLSWSGLRKGGCRCQTSTQFSPAILSWWEECRMILLPFWGVVR
jgi:hypothetical protein